MNQFAIHILELPGIVQRPSKVLAVYLLRPEVSEHSFDGALSHVLASGHQFDLVHFVGFTECVSVAKAWLGSDSSIRNRLELATRQLGSSARFISFDEGDGRHAIERLDGNPVSNVQAEIEAHKRHMLLSLFRSNDGHMIAPPGFHYVKPSEKHVNTFLRAANVLECAEAAFVIAFWCMPSVWRKNIGQIIIDTSGISDVALTMAYEVFTRSGATRLPVVHSHRSYDGLAQLQISRPNETLILVSATTSGSLREELIALGADSNAIVTLFYLGDTQNAGNVLCDLTKRSEDDNCGFDSIANFSEAECPYCKQKSYPVSLGGDQFAFEPPRVQEITVALSDLPESKQQLFDQLAGIDFFKVYRNVNERNLEICLDVGALFSKPGTEYRPTTDLLEEVAQRWRSLILRGAPVNLRRVVYASYPLSDQLAEAAGSAIREHHGKFADLVLSARDLRQSNVAHEAAALVITSCIDDTHELMAINRDLRAHHPRGNTTYISPIFRADTSAERSRIKSNLTFGENGVNTFSLHSIIDLELPTENGNHSWNTELTVLRKITDWADLQGREVPDVFAKRIDFLEQAPTTGIAEELFWTDFQGRQLRVRSDFTLLNTQGGTRKISQADIFVVVSGVLHSLRQGVPGKPKLAYRQYERAVLSPDIFDRFNDGVIQAAILRAVRGYELAYGNCDETLSGRMKDFILSCVENIGKGDGESLAEFLLALATGRMTLFPGHVREITKEGLNNSIMRAV